MSMGKKTKRLWSDCNRHKRYFIYSIKGNWHHRIIVGIFEKTHRSLKIQTYPQTTVI